MAEPTAEPEALGASYEHSLDRETRRRRGAFYTPAALADELAAATLAHLGPGARVCDPAAGTGALLIAAARVLLARGADPRALAEQQLAGADTDGAALAVARDALRLLLGHEPLLFRETDSLRPGAWAPATFDAVIANPPFLNQLQARTVRTRDDADTLRATWGPAAAGYADTANVFLVLAAEMVRDGGRIGIILPEPLLSARDASTTRRQIGRQTEVERIWRPGLGAFDAGVRVWVSVMRRCAPADGPWSRGEWARVAATGVPDCAVQASGVIGDLAHVTADFRDQYYGVTAVAHDRAEGAGAPLVTSGLVDPAHVGWGERLATIAGTRMLHPRADVDAMTPRLRAWAASRLVPKILVATQTRVLEAAVDECGDLLPMVPVITVVAPPDRLWLILAVLLAPPVSVIAHREHTGSALSADAIKLSARQVAALPLPARRAPWVAAATAARRATAAADTATWRAELDHVAHRMCDAYGADAATVMPWWGERVDRLAARHPIGSGA